MRLQTQWMFLSSLLLASLRGASLGAGEEAPGDAGRGLLGILVRKGILTTAEAEELRVEAKADSTPGRVPVAPSILQRISLGLRLQLQQAYFSSASAAAARVETTQGFVRRAYVTMAGSVGERWEAVVTYDLASASFDEAVVRWNSGLSPAIDFGLRKVDTAYEEQASSGDLKSIERSGVTRFFTDDDNGRRLGVAGYRLGVFAGGKLSPSAGTLVMWSAALTNRERVDTWQDAVGTRHDLGRGAAFWGTIGWRGHGEPGHSMQTGLGFGWMPGVSAGPFGERRPEVALGTVHLDWRGRGWNLLTEVLGARIAATRGEGETLQPLGGFLQPGFAVGENRELVFRFSWLDAGGRGLRLSDVVRSAPPRETFGRFVEGYAGLNWYLRGNDLKLQLGGIWARVHGDRRGGAAEERAVGARSQLQIQF
jgi:hypothetical protein